MILTIGNIILEVNIFNLIKQPFEQEDCNEEEVHKIKTIVQELADKIGPLNIGLIDELKLAGPFTLIRWTCKVW